jgi:hypothetical protein
VIGRRLVGQPNLNVHAGLDASKDEIGHFSNLTRAARERFDLPQSRQSFAGMRRERSCAPEGRSFGHLCSRAELSQHNWNNGEIK